MRSTSMLSEYDRLDGLALAELVKSAQISSAEIVDEMRARIEAQNPALNAVVRLFESELAKQPPSEGIFAGLPMLVKDLNIYVDGQPSVQPESPQRVAIAAIDDPV
jgi:amidase